MTWIKIDDAYPEHRKLKRAGDLRALCMALDLAGMCFCGRFDTDGFITDDDLPGVLEVLPPIRRRAILIKLVEIRRWERDDERGGYWVRNYLKYNPSAAERERQAKAGRERARVSRERRAANVRRSNGEAPANVRRSLAEGAVTPSPSPYNPTEVVPFLTVVGSDEEPPNQTEGKGKARRPGRRPRIPRHPSDPFVSERVRQIRAEQGVEAAMAYLRTVGENFGTEDQAAQLARLERWMADNPEPNQEGAS